MSQCMYTAQGMMVCGSAKAITPRPDTAMSAATSTPMKEGFEGTNKWQKGALSLGDRLSEKFQTTSSGPDFRGIDKAIQKISQAGEQGPEGFCGSSGSCGLMPVS